MRSTSSPTAPAATFSPARSRSTTATSRAGAAYSGRNRRSRDRSTQPSLRGAQRRSNPWVVPAARAYGLLRYARNDGDDEARLIVGGALAGFGGPTRGELVDLRLHGGTGLADEVVAIGYR